MTDNWFDDNSIMDPNYMDSTISLSGDASMVGGSGYSSSGMGGFASGLKAAGMLGKAYGTLQVGKEVKAADEYNAALVREQGVMEQYQIDKAEVSLLSTQRAMYAKSGVTQSGSPLDTALASAAGFELDKQIANYNTQSKANMLDYEGKMAEKNAKSQATMQLLEGAGTMALMFL